MGIRKFVVLFSQNLSLAITLFGSPVLAAKFFADVTASSQVGQVQTQGLAFSDFNKDGWVDFAIEGKLFQNISTASKIQFRDVTQKLGLQNMRGRPLFADLNNDGTLEILTTEMQIFYWSGVQYKDESKKRGLHVLRLPHQVMTLSVGDYNRDGWVDLLFGLTEEHKDSQFIHFPPVLYKNINGQSFQEASSELGLNDYSGYTRGIAWADFNNDTYIDFYLSNYRLSANFLFVNRFGQFKEQGQIYGVRGEYQPKKIFDSVLNSWWGPQYGHSIGATWADFNNDGYFDLWVSNLVHKYVGSSPEGYDIRGYVCDDSPIYKNIQGRAFQNIRPQSLIPYMPRGGRGKYRGDELWSHVVSGDLNNDGFIDVYVAQVYNLNYAHSLLFLNQGDFKFQEISNNNPVRVIDSYTGALADLNNDGQLDLVVSGRDHVDGVSRLKVLKNINQNKNHFLKFQLVGTKSGKTPIGAQIRIITDSQTLVRQFEGATGTMNQQNDPTLHFGIPRGAHIKQIEVLWPSGHRHQINLNSIRLNQTFQIREMHQNARLLSTIQKR